MRLSELEARASTAQGSIPSGYLRSLSMSQGTDHILLEAKQSEVMNALKTQID